jgi:BirA family biotin operon repressor/biotin-[acetyl-CoA-carboxylase] ligase
MLTEDNLKDIFKGEIIGKEIIFLRSTTSTNDIAIEIGQQREDIDGIVIITDEQTGGRGRFGRCWISPPGVNLYFTVLLKPPSPPAEASVLTLAAPVAVVSAIRTYTGLQAEIKWPNDILINKKKTGGILMEMKSRKGRISLIAAGIGVNVNMPLDAMTDDIRQHATSLKIESRKHVDRVELLRLILSELEKAYKILLNGNKRALINEWLRLNSTIGNKIKIQMEQRILSGFAEGITEMGELILRLPSGGAETINAGEVTVLKD